MKPWQSKAAHVQQKAARPPFDVKVHVRGMSLLLSACRPFWKESGRRRPIVAQFRVPGDAGSSWYVAVDADRGGVCAVGLHPSPSVTWESDVEAMRAAFLGKVLPGRVRIHGDFETMRALFTAIAQTQLPGAV